MNMRNKLFCLGTSIVAAAALTGIGVKGLAVEGNTQKDRSAKAMSAFYCNIKALTPAERAHHKELGDKIDASRVETKELLNGYAFQFRPESISPMELGDWVAAESKCCPFFDFSIELERDGGPLWLKLMGKEGVKEFIRLEFKNLEAQ